MLKLAAANIFLGLEPTDMRKSFDTLAARVREHLHGDPLSGSWYVFRNKAGALDGTAYHGTALVVTAVRHGVEINGATWRTAAGALLNR